MIWIQAIPTLIFIIGWNKSYVFASRILGILPLPSPSHHIWNRALMLALASRGHHITVITPDPENEPVGNYTEIIIEGAYDRIEESGFDYELMSTLSYTENAIKWFHWGQDACQFAMSSKAAQKLLELQGKETFDLIIIDMTLMECFLGYVPKFGFPPVIAVTAYVSPPWFSTIVGNPQIPSYTNTYILPYTDHMTFGQRMINFLLHNYVWYYRTFYHLPALNKIVRKHLGDSSPELGELERNISLVMVNTHFSMDYPRPIVPAMIPVGGIHIKPGKELSQNLKKFLDGAEHGAIFFSLGTNVKSDKMSKEKIQAFLDAFSELRQRILWKWESDSLPVPGQPKNVLLGKWLPQNDILAHPNVCLFISHSGMLSVQEATYHGVPVVGIPFMADQHVNIVKLAARGVGEKLEYDTLSKESILKTLHAVLENPSYKQNMKKLSKIFTDQPQTPLERAVYWTEYVLRHKGATHLRSVSADLPWYKYLLIDVTAVLFTFIIISVLILYMTVRSVQNINTYCKI